MKYGIFFICLASISLPIFSQSSGDALELYRQGQFTEAIAITAAELAEDPQNLNAYIVRGWSLLAINDYQASRETAERGFAVSRYDSRLIQIMGESLYGLNNYDAALQYFQEYVTLSPSGNLVDEVYATMGSIFLEKSSYHRAEIAFAAATFFRPDRAGWWERLGYAREQLQSYAESLVAYEQALILSPDFSAAAEAYQRVSRLLSDTGG